MDQLKLMARLLSAKVYLIDGKRCIQGSQVSFNDGKPMRDAGGMRASRQRRMKVELLQDNRKAAFITLRHLLSFGWDETDRKSRVRHELPIS